MGVSVAFLQSRKIGTQGMNGIPIGGIRIKGWMQRL